MRPFNDTAAKPVPAWAPWPSPVSPAMLTGGTVGLSELQVDGEAVLWLEARADEGGRRALVRWTPGAGAADVLGPASDVGTRVHEYGGGAYVAASGIIVYSERSDGAVWVIDGGAPRPLVTVPGCRYAAFALDVPRRRVYAVREDHRDRPPTDPENTIVALALDADTTDAAGEVLFRGTDFVLGPQLSPDGSQLAVIAWNHPQMPWDGTELYRVPLDANGAAGAPLRVAGGTDEAIVAVEWAPDGELVFASDRTGWWNLYAWRDGAIRALAADTAEFGEPPWVLGSRSFVALGDGMAVCKTIRDGVVGATLVEAGGVRDLGVGSVASAPLPYGDGVAVITTAPDAPAAIVLFARDGATRQLRTASATPLDPADVSIGEPHVVPTEDGEQTHVTYYPARNARVPDGAPSPPLIVMSHGGPTAMHATAYDVEIAAWTTRGFAVAHVNYRGSSGFGRAYRRRLDGAWGVVDVLDCIAAARYFGASGACDAARIAIRGGSASGMTALLAVATSDLFAAAVTRYGVMDLAALAAETHKFEARYTDGLIGPLPAAAELYRERSPLTHADAINTPVLIMQGLEDHVVPPDQATSMRDALLARGIRVDYEAFAGEGHGFRKAATIQHSFERELAFYTDVFGS